MIIFEIPNSYLKYLYHLPNHLCLFNNIVQNKKMNKEIRADFPILQRTVYDQPLVYLDNAATTQKPRCVVEKMMEEYMNVNANIHRGVHFLSRKATEAHEEARRTVQQFINAGSHEEIIFTRGTTESINLIAS